MDWRPYPCSLYTPMFYLQQSRFVPRPQSCNFVPASQPVSQSVSSLYTLLCSLQLLVTAFCAEGHCTWLLRGIRPPPPSPKKWFIPPSLPPEIQDSSSAPCSFHTKGTAVVKFRSRRDSVSELMCHRCEFRPRVTEGQEEYAGFIYF